jgi:Tat protein secretion system quality control protein TatD with DNase activity
MCQQHHEDPNHDAPPSSQNEDQDPNREPFPWDVGVFDAHCHPTDTMSSIASIPTMSARALTVMATRSQDQDLVATVASTHGITNRTALASSTSPSSSQRIIPAFGWHPWFSCQLYDDSLPAEKATYSPDSDSPESAKSTHYKSVLSPSPEDETFITSLPDPTPLSAYLSTLRSRLSAFPLALIGEVGLDKAFRLPTAWTDEELRSRDTGLTPGGREGRWLSPYRVSMPHQTSVLLAQLRLAGELGRAVSVHGVQAHGVLFDSVSSLWKGREKEVVPRRKQKMVARGAEEWDSDSEAGEEDRTEGGRRVMAPMPFPPRICLHSFSGPVQVMRQWLNSNIPANIYFSFSVAINLSSEGGAGKFPEVVKACPDERILIESDLHIAGERMDGMLEEMYRKVCEIKGWGLREGAEKIRRNYEEFIFG